MDGPGPQRLLIIQFSFKTIQIFPQFCKFLMILMKLFFIQKSTSDSSRMNEFPRLRLFQTLRLLILTTVSNFDKSSQRYVYLNSYVYLIL